MKKLIYSLAFVAVVFLITGCASLKKMNENAGDINYTVEPEVPEMHAGKVAVSISGKFPEKYFHKKATALVTPVFVYDGGEKALESVSIQGEKVDGNNQSINYKEGGNFTYSDEVAYDDDMLRSHLEIRVKASKGSKSIEFDPYRIAEGIVATPALVQDNPRVVYAKDKFQKDIPASQMAELHFDKNKARINNSEKRDDDIDVIKNYIAKVKEDDRKRFDNMEVHGYASPEGEQELNEGLSNDRADVAKEFIDDEFKDMEELNDTEFFLKHATKEDWAGFEKLIKESSLEEKDMILRVLQMHSDVDQREKEFRNMTKVFKELEEEIHPKLRRSEMKLNVTLIGHTDAEIKSLIDTDIDSLEQEELLYAATLYDDNNKKLSIYKEYSSKFQSDWRGHNNEGCAQYLLGNVDAAKTAFEKAKAADGNATVLNNLGAVELVNGNVDKAEEYFTSATGIGNAPSYNQGIIRIKEAKYDKAASFFGDDCSFNAALANLLNGDNDAAIRLAECGDDKDQAMNYYIKAIAGARKGDTELLYNNLRTACTKDDALKAHAAKDVEFLNYFEEQTFKNIVE